MPGTATIIRSASPRPKTSMDLTQHHVNTLRRLAFWCAMLVLVITSLSAFIRLSQAGLGCTPWPGCFGSALQAAQHGVVLPVGDSAAVQVARLAHRVIATVALAGVLALVALCLVGRPRRWGDGLLALLALLLTVGLAVLGVWTRGARVPAVALGNLLGGMLLVAVCWRIATGAARPVRAGHQGSTAVTAVATLVSLALLGQIGLGALTSASYAGLSCSGLLDCLQSSQAAHWRWDMLDPWREPVWDAEVLPVHGAAAVTQLVHRLGAMVLTVLLLALAALAMRDARRRLALLLLLLLALQLVAGVLMVATGLALPIALAHNLLASMMLAVALRLI